MRTTIDRFVAVSLIALNLGACSSVALQHEGAAFAPIEVIESNYVESTNDAEIVFTDTQTTPRQPPAAGQVIAA